MERGPFEERLSGDSSSGLRAQTRPNRCGAKKKARPAEASRALPGAIEWGLMATHCQQFRIGPWSCQARGLRKFKKIWWSIEGKAGGVLILAVEAALLKPSSFKSPGPPGFGADLDAVSGPTINYGPSGRKADIFHWVRKELHVPGTLIEVDGHGFFFCSRSSVAHRQQQQRLRPANATTKWPCSLAAAWCSS